MANIEIPLDIQDVKVVEVEITKKAEIIITVESTIDGTYCHVCGRKLTKRHGPDRAITLRHLSILNMKTCIRIRPVRYQCTDCNGKPTTTQKLPWYDERSPHTRAYEEHILLELINNTVEDVRIKSKLGYEAVMGIIKRNVRTEVNCQSSVFLL